MTRSVRALLATMTPGEARRLERHFLKPLARDVAKLIELGKFFLAEADRERALRRLAALERRFCRRCHQLKRPPSGRGAEMLRLKEEGRSLKEIALKYYGSAAPRYVRRVATAIWRARLARAKKSRTGS